MHATHPRKEGCGRLKECLHQCPIWSTNEAFGVGVVINKSMAEWLLTRSRNNSKAHASPESPRQHSTDSHTAAQELSKQLAGNSTVRMSLPGLPSQSPSSASVYVFLYCWVEDLKNLYVSVLPHSKLVDGLIQVYVDK